MSSFFAHHFFGRYDVVCWMMRVEACVVGHYCACCLWRRHVISFLHQNVETFLCYFFCHPNVLSAHSVVYCLLDLNLGLLHCDIFYPPVYLNWFACSVGTHPNLPGRRCNSHESYPWSVHWCALGWVTLSGILYGIIKECVRERERLS